MAFESMREASQYGQILQFLKESYGCNDVDSLITTVFNGLKSFDLSSCLQVRLTNTTLSYRPQNTPCTAIEQELFDVLKNEGRLCAFGSRLMVNDQHVSILIKNMPPENDSMFGRIRDIVAVIIESFEARVMDCQRKNAMGTVMSRLNDTMNLVQQQFIDYERENVAVMDNLVFDISSSLHILDLNEEQETFFVTLVQTAMENLVDACDNGKCIELEIKKVARLIEPLANC